jgi:hypothetical protein
MPTAGRREPARRRPVPERGTPRSAAARRLPWRRAWRSGWRWCPSTTWPCWIRADTLADRRGLDRDVALDLGALDLGGAQPRDALTLRHDDSIARRLGFKALPLGVRPIPSGAAQRDTSAGSISTSAPVLAVVDLGAAARDVRVLADGSVRGAAQLRMLRGWMRGRRPCGRSSRCALAGRPCTGRSVEVEVQAPRRACGPVQGAQGGFAALVEVALCSVLVALVVAVLAVLAVLAIEVALVALAPVVLVAS